MLVEDLDSSERMPSALKPESGSLCILQRILNYLKLKVSSRHRVVKFEIGPPLSEPFHPEEEETLEAKL